MPSRSERIAAHIAKRIVANTNKKFSTLHSEVLDIIRREDMDSNNLAVQTPEVVVEVKQTSHVALEGSNVGNHLTPAAPAELPSQAGPREQVPAPKDTL